MHTTSNNLTGSLQLRLPVVLLAGFFMIGLAAGFGLTGFQSPSVAHVHNLIIYWGLILIALSVCFSSLSAIKEPELPIEEVRTSSASDDLTVIEGIGPKLSHALNSAGINTFKQLASTPKDHIRTLLNRAGIRMIPGLQTWNEQAVLADEGEWDQLQQLQDELTADRRRP